MIPVAILAQAMSSIDGDELASEQPSVAGAPAQSCESDVAPELQPQSQSRLANKGPLMFFLILACTTGLCVADFAQMAGLEIEWADTRYGDGQTHLVGAVLGHWEFCAGAEEGASDEAKIFVDLASLHSRGEKGSLCIVLWTG